LGIGIAFRKSILKAAGGFNEQLQVFEWLELSLRLGGYTSVKIPELTVLHLEPKSRFTLTGFLRRRIEYGFWYHSLYYLNPKRLSFYAFPVKLTIFLALLVAAVIFRSYVFLFGIAFIYLIWTIVHYRLLKPDNVAAYAASNFDSSYEKGYAFMVAILVLTLGELAGDIGKLWGMLRSPTRQQGGKSR
jgi:hypothetical protein